jgi:hypothetical protein
VAAPPPPREARAAIVYRKEPQARQEPPPAPPQLGRDIEFIKKTVRQSGAPAQERLANVAVNLPSMAPGPAARAGTPRELDRQAQAIADRVYGALERRLRSEQMRKGLI